MIERVLRNPTDNILFQLVRYTFAGAVAFLVDFTLLYVLTEFFGVYYLISAAVAFCMGLAVKYTMSVAWVFNRRTIEKKWLEFGIFASIGICGLFLTEFFIWFLTEHVHFYYLLSKLVSVAIIFFWNFIARKLLLFR